MNCRLGGQDSLLANGQEKGHLATSGIMHFSLGW